MTNRIDEQALAKIGGKTFNGAEFADTFRRLAITAEKSGAAFAEAILHYSTDATADQDGVWLPSIVLRVKLSGEGH